MDIALLTPYTGGNLGDAAIQEAAIQNVRTRYPDARLCLVSILPKLTAGLHDVPSFPLGRRGQWPDEPASATNASDDAAGRTSQAAQRGVFGRVKVAVKAFRPMYSILKRAHDKLWPVYDELVHIRRVYRFLKSVDLVLVSGGGQLDEYWGGPWGHPYALFKWGLLAKITSSRFVVLSVGTCALESKVSAFFIRNALRLASYRSYRDQTSKELLKDIAFTRDDEVYPDLAFSYSNNEVFEPSAAERTGKIVGVSPIAYLASRGWPDEDSSVFDPYFDSLIVLVHALIQRGYSVVLFSSDGPDREIVNDMVETLTKGNNLGATGRLKHPPTLTLPDLLEQLRKVDYVVASRLHGVIVSHRFCLPVLAISYDRKVDTYMADVGLSQYCMDIHTVRSESLIEAFETMVAKSDSIRSTLSQVNNRYARDLQRQYDVVLKQYEERDPS